MNISNGHDGLVNKSIMKVEEFVSQVDDGLMNNRVLKGVAEPQLSEWLFNYLKLPGKRIRPAVLWAVYQHLGGEDWETLKNLGIALELTHNWTLIEDDWMDRDEQRRGKPALHMQIAETSEGFRKLGMELHYGETVATLAANIMQSAASQQWASAIVDLPNKALAHELVRYFESIVGHTGRGQMLDFLYQDKLLADELVTEEQVATVMLAKTGGLFKVACWTAAKLAGANDVDQWAELGEELGYIFQMHNDLKDLDDESGARQRYSDILEMKPTLLNVRLLQILSDEDKHRWQLAVRERTGADVDWLVERAMETGIVLALKEELAQRLSKLRERFIALSETIGKSALLVWLDKLTNTRS